MNSLLVLGRNSRVLGLQPGVSCLYAILVRTTATRLHIKKVNVNVEVQNVIFFEGGD